jgi:hypothetical protein
LHNSKLGEPEKREKIFASATASWNVKTQQNLLMPQARVSTKPRTDLLSGQHLVFV